MATKAAATHADPRQKISGADLLIELGCEDLPARFVFPLAEALMHGIGEGLLKHSVVAGQAHTFATPRRLATMIEGVVLRQPDRAVERKGPKLAAALKDGAPTPAGLGFAFWKVGSRSPVRVPLYGAPPLPVLVTVSPPASLKV